MALLAGGWHLSSHSVAIGLSVMAYATARRHAADPRFAFGAWGTGNLQNWRPESGRL